MERQEDILQVPPFGAHLNWDSEWMLSDMGQCVFLLPYWEGVGSPRDLIAARLGTLTSVTWGGGAQSQGGVFQSSNNAVTFTQDTALRPTAITIVCIALAQNSATGGILVCGGNFNGTNVPYLLSAGSPTSGAKGFAFYNGAWKQSSNSKSWMDGLWHVFVGTYDGLTLSFYVDGKLDSSGSFTGSLPTSNANALSIGRYPNDGFNYLTGYQAFTGIWNYAWPAGQVAEFQRMGPNGLFVPDSVRRFYSIPAGVSSAGWLAAQSRMIIGSPVSPGLIGG